MRNASNKAADLSHISQIDESGDKNKPIISMFNLFMLTFDQNVLKRVRTYVRKAIIKNQQNLLANSSKMFACIYIKHSYQIKLASEVSL